MRAAARATAGRLRDVAYRIPLFVVLFVGAVSLFVIGCLRQKVELRDAHSLPRPDQLALPTPEEVYDSPAQTTEAAMRNVLFHVDDDMRLNIRHLRGQLSDVRGRGVRVLDEKNDLVLDMAHAEIALDARALTIFLNRYVFGYRGSPLKDLVVKIEGDHIVQTGTMHKIIDIPFEMTAQLLLTADGRIRIHTTRMEICSLDGEKLLKAVGRELDDLLDLSGAKGVVVQGNDIIMEPLRSLPPPAIRGKLTGVRIEGNELVQTFGSPDAASALPLPPAVEAQNYIYFKGSNIRFGKLYMVLADMLTIDGDPSDPFDFYLDHYHTQLVAGYHVTLENYALVTWMPDFDDLGGPKGKLYGPPIVATRPIPR